MDLHRLVVVGCWFLLLFVCGSCFVDVAGWFGGAKNIVSELRLRHKNGAFNITSAPLSPSLIPTLISSSATRVLNAKYRI
jgi:hypothetical protein